MPEGDTIHTVARVMRPDLEGQVVVLLEVHQRPCAWAEGSRATSVEAVGKHLVITLEGAFGVRTLRVHLGMKGSWHRYRPGEVWPRPASGRRALIATAEWLFVCFGPKEVALGEAFSGDTAGAARARAVGHLGPDLLAGVAAGQGVFAARDAVERARHPGLAAMAVADVLLTQTVASGIGNVYKSETLFLERVDPWCPVGALDDARLLAIYERAATLMKVNVEAGGWRTTTRVTTSDDVPAAERYWVYRRARHPCRVCGALVRSRLQGPMARMTYWCPKCQVHGKVAGSKTAF